MVNLFKCLGLLILTSLMSSAVYLWAMFPMNPNYGQWAFGVSLYLLVIGLSVLLFGHGLAKECGSYPSGCFRAGEWVVLWHGMTGSVMFAGGLIGAILFLVVGWIFDWGAALGLLNKGFKDGIFYAFIWAPGLSFVACFMIAFGKREK